MLINGMLTIKKKKKNHMQVWGNLVDEVSKKGRRLDLRDPIRWFKNFCRLPERSLGTDPHRLGTTHAQTAQDGCTLAPHGAMEAIKLLMSLMETTTKKRDKEQRLQVQMVVRHEENRTTCKKTRGRRLLTQNTSKGERQYIYCLTLNSMLD